MQSGELTVTGIGTSLISLSGKPREVLVHFKCEVEHVPCNPHHHDKLKHKIEYKDEDLKEHHKHHKHHPHHVRLFFLLIEWEVSSIRDIEWTVLY